MATLTIGDLKQILLGTELSGTTSKIYQVSFQSVANSGFSFGISQLDIGVNGDAQAAYKQILDGALSASVITQVQYDRLISYSGKSRYDLDPVLSLTYVDDKNLLNQSVFSRQQAKDIVDTADSTWLSGSVLPDVQTFLNTISSTWGTATVFDPSSIDYHTAVAAIASLRNRTGGLTNTTSHFLSVKPGTLQDVRDWYDTRVDDSGWSLVLIGGDLFSQEDQTPPDLVIDDLTIGASASVGGGLDISTTVRDNSSGRINDFDIKIYFSTDQFYSSNAHLFTTVHVTGGLLGQHTFTWGESALLPDWIATAGQYYVLVIANQDQSVFEVNFSNDSLSRAFTVDDTGPSEPASMLPVAPAGTATITHQFLWATDPDNTPAQITYHIADGPAHGTLLVDGAAATSFTQADIDAGLVGYRNSGDGASLDGFSFVVDDPAGNRTPLEDLQIGVLTSSAPVIENDYGMVASPVQVAIIHSGVLDTIALGDTPAQMTYTIVSGPGNGTLLLSGAAATSFTQADIDNYLVRYQADNSGGTSDRFIFRVTDGTGNSTAAATFNIAILPQPLPVRAEANDIIAVNNLYGQLLGRTPDTNGFATWITTLANGAAMQDVRSAIAHSDEAQQDLVGFYRGILGREPDEPGLVHWIGELADGESLTRVRTDFARSPEAQQDLTQLYATILSRIPDPSGLAHWTDDLANGSSLAMVRMNIAYSAEARRDLTTLFQSVEQRLPNVAELAGMAGQLNGTDASFQMVASRLAANGPSGFAVLTESNGDKIITASGRPEVFDFSGCTWGATTITGFDPSKDALRLPGGGSGNPTIQQTEALASRSDTLITFGAHQSVTLAGVSPDKLIPANFT